MAFALAAGIGGASSIISGLLGSSGSKAAAQEQGQAAQNDLNFQNNLVGLNLQDLNPFKNNGVQDSNTLTSLLNPGSAESTLESLPGFKFASKWGTKATQNSLAAEGLGGSTGPLAQAISNYNNGLASTNFSNFANLLQNGANTGVNAASAITGATNTAAAQGGAALTNQGNAAASGSLGSANALSGALSGASGSASNSLLLSQLLGNSGSGGIFGGGSGSSSLNGVDWSGLFG